MEQPTSRTLIIGSPPECARWCLVIARIHPPLKMETALEAESAQGMALLHMEKVAGSASNAAWGFKGEN